MIIWNSFKIGLRNLWRSKLFNTINIIGLSLGIACFLGIMAYAIDEFNYDKHHPDYENIFRLILKGNMSGTEIEATVTGGPVSKILFEELPDVISYTRLLTQRGSVLFEYENKKIYQDKILFADSLFFKMFSYDLIGDPVTALMEPYSLVLTKETAKKYFGDENPIGKSIKWNNGRDYIVKAIIKEPLKNSHIKFNVLASRSSYYTNPRYRNFYNSIYAFTNIAYVKCSSNDIDELNPKIKKVFDTHVGSKLNVDGTKLMVELQPIKDIHLNSELLHEIEANGDYTTVFIFLCFAFLVLIISTINYINLSIANSSNRTLEIGLRKVLGSKRISLIAQFLIDSLFITLLSLLLSVILLQLISPIFDSITTKSFSLILQENLSWENLTFFAILLTLISGTYPALYLSSLQPIKSLKGTALTGNYKSKFRVAMIFIQFFITISLLSSTLLINKQIQYIQSKDMGFDKRETMIISLRSASMIEKYELIKKQLLEVPGVIDCSASSSYLGSFNQRREFYRDDFSSKEMLMIMNLKCEPNFLDLLNIKIKEGRNFASEPNSDFNKIIVNEALIKKFEIKDPIGKAFRSSNPDPAVEDPKYEIIGVCNDFNYASLHEEIKPLIIWKDETRNSYVALKVNTANLNITLDLINKSWMDLFPAFPFEYFFLEEQYERLYKADVNVNKVFTSFTILAILIACLGIFALTTYTTERRRKEIGIRKAMGASVIEIMKLISLEYLLAIILAALISIPITWYFMDQWLNEFTYKVNISASLFVVSAVCTILLALIAINLKAYAAAMKNPAEVIKYE